MKIRYHLLLGLLLWLAMVAAAPAVTIQTPWDSGGAEENLYQIISGWGFAVDNDILQNATPLESLPAGEYSILHYASYASKSQLLGVYPLAATPPGWFDDLPAGASLLLDPDHNTNQACNIDFTATTDFGFFDVTSCPNLLTTQEQLLATIFLNQSNGLIFDLSAINPDYAGQYIVAFEDEGFLNFFSDMDYNDLVIHLDPVPPNNAPLPGTLPLLSSGLLSLGMMAFWRRRRASAGS